MDITSTLLAAASAGGTQPGVTWTSNTPSPAPVTYWRDSATSGSVTLLLGTGNTISYSTDTVNFSLYTITPSNPSVTITGVSYVNSQFVAFGSLASLVRGICVGDLPSLENISRDQLLDNQVIWGFWRSPKNQRRLLFIEKAQAAYKAILKTYGKK